jgi:hypothetical protein
MNAMNKIDPVTVRVVTYADDSSLYVLMWSTLATLVSLAGVWVWSASTYAPVIGA